MLKNITSLLLLLSISFHNHLFSQNINQDFTKDILSERLIASAKTNIKTGKFYLEEDMHYNDALKYFLRANKLNSENHELNYLIGYCYYKQKKYKTANQYFAKSWHESQTYNTKVFYYLGRSHHFLGQWKRALYYFEKYRDLKDNTQEKVDSIKVNRLMNYCKNGILEQDNSVLISIEKLPKQINSTTGDEFSPIITPEENKIFFNSNRRGTTGLHVYSQPKEDVFYSLQRNGRWRYAESVSKLINTNNHESVTYYSEKNNALIFYRGTNNGDLYISFYRDKKWQKPNKLPGKVNSAFQENSAVISKDLRTIIFTSDRTSKESKGGFDIYIIKKVGNKWLKPKVLATLNTNHNEEGLYLDEENHKLYFSSDRASSFGGFDFYCTALNKNYEPIGEIEHLPFPINTPFDDLHATFLNNGKTVYKSILDTTKRAIYHHIVKVNVIGEEKPVQVDKSEPLLSITDDELKKIPLDNILSEDITLFSGYILDSLSHRPVPAVIEVMNITDNKKMGTLRNQREKGYFAVRLPSGKNYNVSVKSNGYLFYSKNFDLPTSKGLEIVKEEILLSKPTVGGKIVLNNIFFLSGSTEIEEASNTELENIYKTLKIFPNIRVEISGHTDNIGETTFNQTLSEKRARNIVDILISRGIDKERLVFKGYGEQQPIADNKTEEGRRLNRRTEFKVIK